MYCNENDPSQIIIKDAKHHNQDSYPHEQAKID